jgi:hypothetical protein
MGKVPSGRPEVPVSPARVLALPWLAAATLLSGCARYNARPLPLLPGNPPVRVERVRCAAAVLAHYREASAVLGSDLKGRGIVPVDLWIRNERRRPIVLDRNQTRLVITGRGLMDLAAEDRARKAAHKSLLGSAGWVTVLAGPALPVAIGASALQIHGVNEEIRRDYEAKAFPVDRPIPSKGEARGLLFFEVAKGYLKNAKPEDLRVSIVTRDTKSGNLQKFDFGVPRSRTSEPLSGGKPFWKYP